MRGEKTAIIVHNPLRFEMCILSSVTRSQKTKCEDFFVPKLFGFPTGYNWQIMLNYKLSPLCEWHHGAIL